METTIIKEVEARINYLRENRDKLVIDGDTHPSDFSRLSAAKRKELQDDPNYYQGRPISTEQLIAELDAAGVDMCIAWQNPAVLDYEEIRPENYEVNFQRLREANRHIHDSSKKYPTRILPCGWTDPKALGVELAKTLATQCVEEFGFSVVKMNPAQNEYSMDSPDILEVVDHIVSLGAIPTFHFGGDSPYTMPDALRRIATQFAESRIIAVHMGGGGSHFVDGDSHYIETRKLGLEHPNLFFVLSAIRDCHIESNLITYQLAGAPFCNNIACGSDAPYGKIVWNFGGFRALFDHLSDGKTHTDPRVRENPALFSPEAIQNYMGRNLADLVLAACENILQVQRKKVKV